MGLKFRRNASERIFLRTDGKNVIAKTKLCPIAKAPSATAPNNSLPVAIVKDAIATTAGTVHGDGDNANTKPSENGERSTCLVNSQENNGFLLETYNMEYLKGRYSLSITTPIIKYIAPRKIPQKELGIITFRPKIADRVPNSINIAVNPVQKRLTFRNPWCLVPPIIKGTIDNIHGLKDAIILNKKITGIIPQEPLTKASESPAKKA
jgi:hypothetical protein